ncbi:MAG: Toluene tolerance precursor [bacterium]|nr:Toluene tolerance precursor [bacterium]
MIMRTLAIVLVLSSVAVAAPAAGPMATLKQKNGEVDKLLRQKVEKGSPQETKQKEEIKQLAGGLLDYQELAQRALAAHWDKLTPAQRNEFVSTLRELIERNYVKQLRSNLDYQVQYRNEENAGAEATVTTVVKVKSPGKSTDAEIIYKMKKDPDGWRVWDVITDEVSLVRGYRTQFNKIITEQSYDALLKKMKSKLKDGE